MTVLPLSSDGRRCLLCGRRAKPGDPGFGQRMTLWPLGWWMSGYWCQRCAELVRTELKKL
jgi:hypothetical protein